MKAYKMILSDDIMNRLLSKFKKIDYHSLETHINYSMTLKDW